MTSEKETTNFKTNRVFKQNKGRMKTSPSLLDSDIPQIDTPLLKPTKYEKPKRKYSKTGMFTKPKQIVKKVASIFDQFKKKPGRPKLTQELQKSWYEKLKESVFDVFNKIHRKPVFILDKKALNATKRYFIDLQKTGLSLYDPIKMLEKVKPVVLEKFK